MPGTILEQYQLYNSNPSAIPKINLRPYIESSFVKNIYIAYGVEKGINIMDPRYQEYVSRNYQKAYSQVKAMKIDDLWALALSGGCLLEASTFQNAMQMLSIIKAAINKIRRDDGCVGGSVLQNGHAYGYLNLIMGDKKYNKKSFTIQLVCDQQQGKVLLQICD